MLGYLQSEDERTADAVIVDGIYENCKSYNRGGEL